MMWTNRGVRCLLPGGFGDLLLPGDLPWRTGGRLFLVHRCWQVKDETDVKVLFNLNIFE